MAGIPKRETQWKKRTSATVSDELSCTGIASGQQENLSMMVTRWLNPRLGGSGPTMSTLMCSKRAETGSNLPMALAVWREIFPFWQAKQVCPHRRQSLDIVGHKYLHIHKNISGVPYLLLHELQDERGCEGFQRSSFGVVPKRRNDRVQSSYRRKVCDKVKNFLQFQRCFVSGQ